jgi:hypothetical protein
MESTLTRQRLKSPRAAALAGILFSVLFIASLVLIRISVPFDPLETGGWLSSNVKMVGLALNLIPFSGIAFLWFIGVVRDRFGEYEDRLFATVFFGSGLLFLAMMFTAAGIAGGIVLIYGNTPNSLLASGIYTFGRVLMYEIANIYALKMAGVFMISTTTLSFRLKLFPRWIIILSYALALGLLLNLVLIEWITVVFPLWVFLISVVILIENYRRNTQISPA